MVWALGVLLSSTDVTNVGVGTALFITNQTSLGKNTITQVKF